MWEIVTAFTRQTLTVWPDMLNFVSTNDMCERSSQHSLGRHSLFDLTCWISSRLTTCVRDRHRFTVLWIKIEQNSCVIVKFNAILGYWRFLQIRQRIFNCTNMQIMYFILDKIIKLLTYYTLFYRQLLLSYLLSKTVSFWPTLYIHSLYINIKQNAYTDNKRN